MSTKLKGRFENCIRGADGVFHFTFATKDNAGAVFDEYNGKDAEMIVGNPTKKKSLNANAYMWELCTQIAEKLSDEGTLTTKEDVYRENIQQVGLFRDIPMLGEGIDTIRKAWELHGTGWVTEIVDYLPDKSGYLVRCYYGSSEYSSKQLSRLIDAVVQDAQALGIDTRTPAEIANLLSLWQQAKDKERN